MFKKGSASESLLSISGCGGGFILVPDGRSGVIIDFVLSMLKLVWSEKIPFSY
jgi:hypothetical protein